TEIRQREAHALEGVQAVGRRLNYPFSRRDVNQPGVNGAGEGSVAGEVPQRDPHPVPGNGHAGLDQIAWWHLQADPNRRVRYQLEPGERPGQAAPGAVDLRARLLERGRARVVA